MVHSEKKETNRFIILLDYMKKTFALMAENKAVLFPIIWYTISKTILGIIFIVSLIPLKTRLSEVMKIMENKPNGSIGIENLQPIISYLSGIPLVSFILFMLVATFGYTWLEANIFTYIAKKLPFTVPKEKGIYRTFGAFILANIIIYFAWIILLIPYILVGLATLTIGFTLLPFLVDMLLMYYKGIYVVTENNIFYSLKESIRFVWQNFVLSMILQIFIIISDVTNLVSTNTYINKANRFLNLNTNFTSDLDSQMESLENIKQIDSLEKGISPMEVLRDTQALDIATNIIVPVAIVLLIAAAIVFFVRRVVFVYFAFTSTYIYCDKTAADELLSLEMEEVKYEPIQ